MGALDLEGVVDEAGVSLAYMFTMFGFGVGGL